MPVRPHRRTPFATFVVLAATVALAFPAVAAVGPDPTPAPRQTEGAPTPTPVLGLGERFVGADWDLEVGDVLVRASEDRFGWSEVRISVAWRHHDRFERPFAMTGPTGGGGLPRLVVEDRDGARYGPTVTRPADALLPTSNLVAQPPEIPARWTLGYQVPTAVATGLLQAVAIDADGPVVGWRLSGSATPASGWGRPEGADTIELGDTVVWQRSDGGEPLLEVTFLAHDQLRCVADGTNDVVIGAVAAEVNNVGRVDTRWPDVRFPETPAIMVWPEGNAARYNDEGHATGADEGDPLDARNEEQVLVPPQRGDLRFLRFITPVDPRFDLASAAQGVWLSAPTGDRWWLELDEPALIGFTLDPANCDDVVPAWPLRTGG